MTVTTFEEILEVLNKIYKEQTKENSQNEFVHDLDAFVHDLNSTPLYEIINKKKDEEKI